MATKDELQQERDRLRIEAENLKACNDGLKTVIGELKQLQTLEHGAKIYERKKKAIEAGLKRLRDRFGLDDYDLQF